MNRCSLAAYADMAPNRSITGDQAIELAEMGDPSRLRIILACLHEPTCGSGPAARMQLSPCLVGHLFAVRVARLLRAEGQGKQVFCSPAAEY
jgi:hypothetical protein